MQIVTKIIQDLAITTGKLANLAVTTGKIAADAVTGAKIRLANLEWLRGRNAANSADLNILRVNASDEIETDQVWNFENALPQSTLAPTLNEELANKAYVDAAVGTPLQGNKEAITLDGTDITNQYVDLEQEIEPETLIFSFSGVIQREGVDYTLSTVGLVTRVTFAGDLATGGAAELVATDVVSAQYLY